MPLWPQLDNSSHLLTNYYAIWRSAYFGDNRDMYVLQSQLKKLPIMSLQTGKSIGTTKDPVVDMGKLEVMAFYCHTARGHSDSLLLMRDIRQISRDALIIDSIEDLSDPADIVRLQQALKENYSPIGAQVADQQGHKLGRVEDYSINIKTGLIQKLYVHQSLMRSMLFNNVLVDRTQIIEAKPRKFIVNDTTTPKLVPGTKAVPRPANGR